MATIDWSEYGLKTKKAKDSSLTSLVKLMNREISFGSKGLPDKKKEAFYLELSTLLLSGIDLRSALNLILVDQRKPADRQVFQQVADSVISGTSLSEALRLSGKFSDYEFFSIRIGEETGKLGKILTDLGAYYKSRIQQKRKIVGAITYPVIVMCTSLAAVFFMIKFVVPMFAGVFLRFGGKLPYLTSVIIGISSFFDQYFYLMLLLVALCIFSIMLNRRKTWFRRLMSSAVLKIPVAGDIIQKVYLARFANTMSLLVSTSTPLLQSISLVRKMISFYPVQTSLAVVEQDILRGESLHASLSKFSFYPDKLVQLVKVGEEVNRLDYFFEKLAVQYTDEVEYRTNTISSVLEPLIIIFLGLIVGVILIAMYLPMFQLSNSF
ncbi:type II secretion system F family protein [Pedobacter sp. HMF7647]|uniref:General secretion pathway protein F n=1 Tax=Hufsiella arboris TaxID=2695275 RepID=A0A7K1Y735_9SPHI|nr:type II secretion system F family protein [Hufsiella arboris]MXV50386.1 type II secretion system F family protein [Hufsiella arboris]